MRVSLFLLFSTFFGVIGSSAQCGGYITTFPYSEGFEVNAGWNAGGFASDWAWGTPDHPLIDAAASGTKAWCVGGLTGTFYNDGQQSWLESPCFDMSSLQYPWISFKLFWECEQQYDGLGFQYSLDQGDTWTNLGSVNSPVHCLQENWFNASFINALNMANPKQGWSGRVGATVGNCTGGNGSGEWVTSSHCLTDLAGEPSVKFRFIFGAGTTCNGYDGIAIDDVYIGEAESNAASFDYTCQGNTVDFFSTAALCPGLHSWNFGDPGSSGNVSAGNDVSHTYPGPGTYQVTLTVSGPCNAPSTVTIPITIVDLELETVDPGCAGDDGSITAVVSGSTTPVEITWSSSGTTGNVISGLAAGSYTATISGNGVCPAQETATLVQQNNPLDVQIEHTDITCAGNSDGSAVAMSSGMEPLIFTWSNGSSGASIASLEAGNYSVEVIDAIGCEGTASVTIDEPVPFTLSTPGVLSMCAGSSMDLEVAPAGGTAPFDLTYDPGGPIVSPIITTNYTVEGVDANGCMATAEVLVEVGGPLMPEFSIIDPQGCAPHCITLITASIGTFEWDLGDGTMVPGNEVQHCYDEGTYQVSLTITDDVGCSVTADADTMIIVHPSPIASFVADPPLTTIEQPQVQLIPQADNDAQLIWSIDGEPLDPQEFSPSVLLDEVDCYRIALEVLSGNGCSANEEIELCIEEAFQVFAPNAFTPNNDGINDGFQVITSVRDPEYFELRIHDRWGQAINIITDPNSIWNAEDIPTGVYIWMLRMRDTLGAIQERSGHVSVIR